MARYGMTYYGLVAYFLYFQLRTFGFHKKPEISLYVEVQIHSEVRHIFKKCMIYHICSYFQLASLLLLIMLATCCSAGSKV
jgi:hypothetical protein